MTDLNTLVQTLYAHITQMPIPITDRGHAAYRRLWRLFRTVLKQLITYEKAQARESLKRAMLSDEAWRQRITHDLGGEAALTEWEARYAKTQEQIHAPQVEPMDDDSDIPKQAGFNGFCGRSVRPKEYFDRIKVDQAGQFCLAPITGGPARPPHAKRTPYVNPFGLKVQYADIDPIAVTPAELREGIPTGEPIHAAAMRNLYATLARANALANMMMPEADPDNSHGHASNPLSRASPGDRATLRKDTCEIVGL